MDDLHLKRINRQIRSYRAFLGGLSRSYRISERHSRKPVPRRFLRSFYGRGAEAISRKEKLYKCYENDFNSVHISNPAQEAKLKTYFTSLTKNFWHKQDLRGYSLSHSLKALGNPLSLTAIGCFEFGRYIARNSTSSDANSFSKLPNHLIPLTLWGYLIQLFVEFTSDVSLPFLLSKICSELKDWYNSLYLLQVAWSRVSSPTTGEFVHFYAGVLLLKKGDIWMKYIYETFNEKNILIDAVKLFSINKRIAVKFAGYFLLSILESGRDVCEFLARQVPQVLEKLLIHISRNLFVCRRYNCCCSKVLLNKRDLLEFVKEEHLQAAFLISRLLTLKEMDLEDTELLERLKGLKFNVGRLLEIFSRLNVAEKVRLYLSETCESLALELAREMVEQYYSLKSHSFGVRHVSLKELKRVAGISTSYKEQSCKEDCAQSPCKLLETPKKAIYQNFTPGEFMMIVPVSPLPETCTLDEILS